MPAIETRALTKIYRGRTVGIAELDLEVAPGEIVGFLGPNGSGKTTTIRLLLDLLRPTSGAASVLGLDTRRDSVEVRRQVGFLPGDLVFHDGLTGLETLEFYRRLRPGQPAARRPDLLSKLDLTPDVLRRRVRTYSTGMRRKLGVVVALQHDPAVAILDEPTTGLDPLVRRSCHDTLRAWQAGGRTLFLSTHDVLEAETLCDRVLIVREGRLIASRTVADLRAQAGDAPSLEDVILAYYQRS